MASENKLQEVVQATLAQIRNMIDADTVMGTPVETKSGTTLIPISKVTLGYATGGMDFNDKNANSTNKQQNFGAGGGTGMSVQPIGILCVSKDGDVDLINIGVKSPSDPIEQLSDLIDRSPEIIAKIKALFAKDNSEESADAE